jgi:hypothetical protein
MFYFRTKPFFTRDLGDVEQFANVIGFRTRLQENGVLFWEYSEPIEFERRFREHLTNQLIELAEPVESSRDREPPRVFLSYKRQDLRRVEPIYEALKADGLNPWIDVRDILAGRRWTSEIETAIRSADFFLTFVSQNSVDPDVPSETGFSVHSEISMPSNARMRRLTRSPT